MAEVDVGVEDLVLHFIKIADVVDVLKVDPFGQKPRDVGRQVVAGHIADLEAVEALFLGDLLHPVDAALDVHAAGVGEDADVFAEGLLAAGFVEPEEVPGEAGPRGF